ncbi:hypothetical protein CAPTEDRAFT_185475 [Capitella teleta]|uniref:G-protein coupled receptors family 1 profile domain-containing protein n=1 Tax=Capitella teleta TaxID=283909 RepID=R7VCE1_CAPTE|nr:hypothetical protein CAPTEDRAFT_185475 [Capitella teleta]|eukprot:ELU16513.1 hypothetical protein CAPTEDRAFT_185475 [Capitella teleta]
MAFYTHGLLWVIITPFILISLIIAASVLISYHFVQRSLDVLLLAFLPALALDAGILVLIQGVIYLNDSGWGSVPCLVYTWAWLWLRITESFLILCLSLERVLFLHAWNYTHRGSWGIKLIAACSWLLAGVIAAIPIIGWDGLDLTVDIPESCNYMAYEIDHQYAIFMLVFELAIAFLGIGCLGDTLLHLRFFNKDFDKVITGGKGRMTPELEERSVCLMTAYESCKLVCVILLVVFLVNHVPHALMTLYVVLTDEMNDVFRVTKSRVVSIPRTAYAKQFERKTESDSMQVLAVPVQQVITRSRLASDNPGGKSNPGFESDDDDDVYEMGRQSRMNNHKGLFKKANNASNASEQSWILVDGFLCRSRPMSESTRGVASSSLVEVHSAQNSSLTDDVTPGTSTSFASSLPRTTRFVYASSDSSSPEIDTRKKMAMIRAPTPSPRGRNIRIYPSKEPLAQAPNACDSDDSVDGGPRCHRDIVQPLSQAMLRANDELHSYSTQDSLGTPSPDSASHLPYYLKSESSISQVSPLPTTALRNTEFGSSFEEGSDMGMISYDDDDIEQVLSSESPKSSSQNMDEIDNDVKSQSDSSSSIAASNSIGVSSAQALSLAQDLNIVSYMNVHPETVEDSSSEANDRSSNEGKYSLSAKDSETDIEMSRYRTLNDLSQLKLSQPEANRTGDTGPNKVYLLGNDGVSRLDFIGVEASKTQVVRPLNSPYAPSTSSQVTVERSHSGVFEEQIVRTIHFKHKEGDDDWSGKSETPVKPARKAPPHSVPDLSEILAGQAHTLPSTKKSLHSAMADVHEELLKKTQYSRDKAALIVDGNISTTNAQWKPTEKSLNGFDHKNKSMSANDISIRRDRLEPSRNAAVVLDAESLLQQQLKKELNSKLSNKTYSPIKSGIQGYRTVVKTIDFEDNVEEKKRNGQAVQMEVNPQSFERVHLKPPDLPTLTIEVSSDVTANGLFTDTDYRSMEEDLKARGRGRVLGTYPVSPGSDVSRVSPGPLSPPVSPYGPPSRLFARTSSQS